MDAKHVRCVEKYLDEWIGRIVEHLDDDPIVRPHHVAGRSYRQLIHLHAMAHYL